MRKQRQQSDESRSNQQQSQDDSRSSQRDQDQDYQPGSSDRSDKMRLAQGFEHTVGHDGRRRILSPASPCVTRRFEVGSKQRIARELGTLDAERSSRRGISFARSMSFGG